MINRDLIPAVLLTYDGSLDAYGQPRTTTPIETAIQVTTPKLYRHSPVEDVRFESVTDTCLTQTKGIKDSCEIKVGDTSYRITFVNDSGRLSQLFLVKK